MTDQLKFRVWIIPQIPCPPFYRDAPTLDEAKRLRGALVDFQLHMYEERVMPRYSNAAGIWVWVPRRDGWEEYDEDDPDHQP